jgi:FAD/FMN-containing dehydrogenase/Fe-S oxidoreductase
MPALTSSQPGHKKKPPPPPDLDVDGLTRRLRRTTRAEVRFDDGSRALYATDASNYRQVPIGVVIPRDADDVVATLAACHDAGAPVLCRGGGTSLAGQCCNVAVVMDFTKYMNRVIEVDTRHRLARVQPGCVLDDLRKETLRHGLNFGPDPATHSHCAIGGMLGNNSCGIHSLLAVKHGHGMRTSDNTHSLEVITYDGERMTVGATPPAELEQMAQGRAAQSRIYAQLRDLRDRYADPIRSHFPKLPRRVSGYNLDELLPENEFHVARALVGSEGTCVTILEATLHLVPNPQARSLLVLGYPDVFTAADHIEQILPLKPTGLEGMDRLLVKWVRNQGQEAANLALLPPGNAWLLVEFGGETQEDAHAQSRHCVEALKKVSKPPSFKLFDDKHQEQMVWKVRESGLAATAWQPGHADNWPGFEDSAVPPEKVPGYLKDFHKLLGKYDYQTSLYGHFGQGCIHCRIGFDLYTAAGIEKYKSFMEEATDLVVKYGGSFSGEHGDGQARAQFLPKLFGEELVQAFREFKRIWDPHWKMNPGKVVDPNPITADLRIGTDYNPPNPSTHFHYQADHGSFSRAALRCVGVGECRKKGGQTMCPSYMVTGEEMHSTRGRARLLWEMLNGHVLKDGWRSEAVKESLDLCLSCKGCKGDCPVQVDMATYKAEFLAHYYQGRLRPRHAYVFGLVHLWARLGRFAPGLANVLLRAPGTSHLMKWFAQVAPERSLPTLAPRSFKHWFRQRHRSSDSLLRSAAAQSNRPPVILWADTFNNYFTPEPAQAAVEVLEHAGFSVLVPETDMCCGRPLYDYGMLATAKRWLEHILRTLRPAIEAGLPVVVLEPSCCSVFRDEMLNLLPNNLDAKRLAQNVFLLGEFLEKNGYQPPKLSHRRALVHGHCHQKALMGMEAEQSLLKKMEVDSHLPESGCCGMAGAFGYEKGDPYEVSIACGERVLLPEVREAGERDLIVADGFSCREQIQQCTNREGLHLAQVIQLALRSGETRQLPNRPEDVYVQQRKAANARSLAKTAVLGVAMGVLGLVVWRARREQKVW